MANSMQLRPPCRQVYFASDGAVCKVHLQECLFDVMPRGIESGLKREEGDWHSLPVPVLHPRRQSRGQAASASPHAAYLLSKRMPRSSPSIVIGNIRLFINCRITEIDWR